MNRKKELLNILIGSDDFQPLDKLAGKLNVSSRTIRNDLDSLSLFLEREGIRIVNRRKLGVKLDFGVSDTNDLSRLIGKVNDEFCLPKKDRQNAIISYILMQERFTTAELCDYLQVAKNTIVNDLEDCRAWFSDHLIDLVSNKKQGSQISYLEYHYRQAYLDMIGEYLENVDFQKFYHSFNSEVFNSLGSHACSFILNVTSGLNITVIKNFISKYESDFMISFSDDSYTKIFFYICIILKRIRKGKRLEPLDNLDAYIDSDNIEWIQINKEMLEEAFGLYIDSTENLGIILAILCENKYYLENAETSSSEEIRGLVKAYIDEVFKELCTQPENYEELLSNLSAHIKPAINRTRFHVLSKNPLKEEIRQTYPQIYRICEDKTSLFRDQININFNDDEIAYIVMHIVSSIRQNEQKEDYFHKVLVVCSSGFGTSNMIRNRLLTEFPNILVKDVCSVKNLRNMDLSDIEFIVSTVSLYQDIEIPCINVSPLLNRYDISRIAEKVDRQKLIDPHYSDVITGRLMNIIAEECSIENYSRLKGRIKVLLEEKETNYTGKKKLSRFLTEGHVSIRKEETDWKSAVKATSQPLIDDRSINECYVERIISGVEDDALSIYLGKGIVLLHNVSDGDVKETSLSMARLNDPVRFPNGEDIWLLFTLAVNESNEHIDAINEIASILNDDAYLNRIKEAYSCGKIIEIIKQFELES